MRGFLLRIYIACAIMCDRCKTFYGGVWTHGHGDYESNNASDRSGEDLRAGKCRMECGSDFFGCPLYGKRGTHSFVQMPKSTEEGKMMSRKGWMPSVWGDNGRHDIVYVETILGTSDSVVTTGCRRLLKERRSYV